MEKCLTDGCTTAPYAEGRGLCMSCYSRAKSMVTRKQTTWEELEQLGLALPQESKFEQAFKNKKASH